MLFDATLVAVHAQTIPKILYKYCPPGRLEPLVDHTLRLTPFNVLNDPWEFLPIIESQNPEIEWQEFLYNKYRDGGGTKGPLHKGFKSFAKRFVGSKRDFVQSFSGNQDSILRLKQSVNFMNAMSRTFGIISLSDRCDSSLMWSHYAGGHEGYVIGIKPTRFVRLHEMNDARLRAIDYKNERQTMQLKDMRSAGIEWQDLMFRKSVDWGYEQEWRFIASFDLGKKVAENLFLMDYGSENLSEIIVGYKSGDKLGQQIDQVRERLPDVTVKFARPSAFTFDVVLENEVPGWLKHEFSMTHRMSDGV